MPSSADWINASLAPSAILLEMDLDPSIIAIAVKPWPTPNIDVTFRSVEADMDDIDPAYIITYAKPSDNAACVSVESTVLLVLVQRITKIMNVNMNTSSIIVEETVPSSNILSEETIDQSKNRIHTPEKDAIDRVDDIDTFLFLLSMITPAPKTRMNKEVQMKARMGSILEGLLAVKPNHHTKNDRNIILKE